MDGKGGVSGSLMVISKENNDSLYPMFLGVSCAFFALKLMPNPEICDERWSEVIKHMLKGSAHLLGLLVWTVEKKAVNTEKEKLENAEKEIAQLKKIRSEDAKANEKVVSIFAGREQSWFHERQNLRRQIGALMNDLRLLEMRIQESVSEFGEKMKEIEVVLQLKGKIIEETEKKRVETEEKLKAAEGVIEELKESVKSEAQRHSSEISKQKTAFIELVSNHRQLEAEMGRAFKQVEAARQELDSVVDEKEELGLANQRLSMELVKMQNDLEQKDQIVSAMLRKVRLDTAEKQMLLKEVKSSKAKRKQAEVEIERWKAVSESKHERYSLRSMLSNGGIPKSAKNRCGFEYMHPERRKGMEPKLAADAKHFENCEADKYKISVEQMHEVETDAFVEQLRQKDEKLEAYSWRLMSTELESKRLQSHIESLNRDITQLRHDNLKLEAILMDRKAELQSLREQLKLCISPPNPHKLSVKSTPHDAAATADDTDWSRVKIVKRKPGQRRQQTTAAESNKLDESSAKEQNQDIVLTLKEVRDSSKISNSGWKMDIHALGVSYKVKRLKQQLFMLERVTGKKENCENNIVVKGSFSSVMSFLNKQVDRYQSLQAKIDDLCMRMHEKKSGGSRTDEEMKRMEQFLEETFQVQRYIVATGQKVMEVQAKIASSFGSDDSRRFSDGIKTLFQQVQRGLEVRVSRIIGDLQGTLTCDCEF